MTTTPRTTPNPEDLSEAIAACKAQCDRLGIHSHHISVLTWLQINGFEDWHALNRSGFIRLYRFLKKCQPNASNVTPEPKQPKHFVYWPAIQRKVEVLQYEGERALIKRPDKDAVDWVKIEELQE